MGVGFFVYYADQEIAGNKLTRHERIGLKEYLIGVTNELIDNSADIGKYQPESYIFEAIKGIALLGLSAQNGDSLLDDFNSEDERACYLSMVPFLVVVGYTLAKVQERFGKDLDN